MVTISTNFFTPVNALRLYTLLEVKKIASVFKVNLAKLVGTVPVARKSDFFFVLFSWKSPFRSSGFRVYVLRCSNRHRGFWIWNLWQETLFQWQHIQMQVILFVPGGIVVQIIVRLLFYRFLSTCRGGLVSKVLCYYWAQVCGLDFWPASAVYQMEAGNKNCRV